MKKKVLIGCILLLVLGILSACGGSMEMRTARLAIRDEDDPDKALEYILQELNKNPDNAEAYLFGAQVYGQYKKDYANAYRYAKKALELDPSKEEEVNLIFETCWSQSHNQGIQYYQEGDYEKALQSLKLANQIFPDSVQTKKALAAVYTELDSLDTAVEYFMDIANQVPDDVTSRQKLAEISFQKKDYEKVLRYYQELSRLEPDNPDWLYNIGVCYSAMGDESNALKYYRQASELRPDDIELLYLIADAEFNNENFEESANFYKKIIEIDDSQIDALQFICYSYSNLKDYENLVTYAHKWIQADPNNVDAYRFLVVGLQETGNVEEAQQYYHIIEELEGN
jgi:tetratricopeptide (TPR) repeat protein